MRRIAHRFNARPVEGRLNRNEARPVSAPTSLWRRYRGWRGTWRVAVRLRRLGGRRLWRRGVAAMAAAEAAVESRRR